MEVRIENIPLVMLNMFIFTYSIITNIVLNVCLFSYDVRICDVMSLFFFLFLAFWCCQSTQKCLSSILSVFLLPGNVCICAKTENSKGIFHFYALITSSHFLHVHCWPFFHFQLFLSGFVWTSSEQQMRNIIRFGFSYEKRNTRWVQVQLNNFARHILLHRYIEIQLIRHDPC